MRAAEPRQLSVRGAEIAVHQHGNGTDLVLVHGFQNDHSAWDPFLDRLDLEHFRVTTFDLVGCGASGGAATWERCTIDEYAADLVEMCDQLQLDAPVAVGHSLGGATVLQAALTWPRRLRALVLVAPASTTGLDFVPDDATFDTLVRPTPADQRELALAAFRYPPSGPELDALLSVISRATPEHIEGAARSMRAFDRLGQLDELDLPAVLVCGDRDRHVPLRNHLATQQAIRRCGLQVWHDVGHVPFAETPDDFAAVVIGFISTVRR